VVILSASRAPDKVHQSRASNSRGYIGLKYERATIAMLRKVLPKVMKLENNPWFYYNSDFGSGACSTDAIIFDNKLGFIIVVEIKNTYTPLAMQKLIDLYCPVVRAVFDKPVKPLVLVKNLVPGSPFPKLSLSAALDSEVPLLQWIGTGTIRL
jgi:hypothetical protein